MQQNIRPIFVNNKPLTLPKMLPQTQHHSNAPASTSNPALLTLLNHNGVHSMYATPHFLPSNDHILKPLIGVIRQKWISVQQHLPMPKKALTNCSQSYNTRCDKNPNGDERIPNYLDSRFPELPNGANFLFINLGFHACTGHILNMPMGLVSE